MIALLANSVGGEQEPDFGLFYFATNEKAVKTTAFNPFFLGTSTHKYVADEALLFSCKARHLGAGAPCCVRVKNFEVKNFYYKIFGDREFAVPAGIHGNVPKRNSAKWWGRGLTLRKVDGVRLQPSDHGSPVEPLHRFAVPYRGVHRTPALRAPFQGRS